MKRDEMKEGKMSDVEKTKERYGYETASADKYQLLKEYSHKLRGEMTPSEKVLWKALRQNIQGFRFRRQHAIGDYIADFICIPARLVIEVDGGYHSNPQQRMLDEIRTTYLEERGYRVMRFSNSEVDCHIKDVILKIKESLSLTPSPSPRGEGSGMNCNTGEEDRRVYGDEWG